MPIASILALCLDDPRLTSQQLADVALEADREARRLERIQDARAVSAREEANAIADASARRAREF